MPQRRWFAVGVGFALSRNAEKSRAFGARAERPLYSVLDLAATEGELQREMMPWREALRMHLDERSSA